MTYGKEYDPDNLDRGLFSHRMTEYQEETRRLRWSQQEMMTLYVWQSKTVEELKKQLPRRSEEEIQQMRDYLEGRTDTPPA